MLNHTTNLATRWLALSSAALLLSACGGGSSSSGTPTGTTDSDRIAAATATARNNPRCDGSAIGAFYWEIGDADGVRASGSIGVGAPSANTPMRVFSASKWIYAAYVLEKHGVRSSDVPYLNFTSGYIEHGNDLCPLADTVAGCLLPTARDDAAVGRYDYASGHMQWHAANVMGLGAMDRAALAAEVQGAIGNFGFTYEDPQMAAGISGTPAAYGAFLRKVLRGELAMGAALGTHKVCTNPDTCSSALSSPDLSGESWNYSLGHWVEDDPSLGDHAFSSAGGGGFYPWIDSARGLYGIVARERFTETDAGYHSAECGRLVRQAWSSGTQVIGPVPTP